MKKVLFLLLSSFLVLAACGNSEESKSGDKKETKSSSKESKKDDKKSKEDKSDGDTKQVAENENTQEQPTAQENIQSQEKQQAPVQQEPTDQEKMEANAKVAKENGYTGISNGDAGLLETSDEYYSDDQLDPDTGLPMDDAIPHKTNE